MQIPCAFVKKDILDAYMEKHGYVRFKYTHRNTPEDTAFIAYQEAFEDSDTMPHTLICNSGAYHDCIPDKTAVIKIYDIPDDEYIVVWFPVRIKKPPFPVVYRTLTFLG